MNNVIPIKRVRKDSKFVVYKITHVDSGKTYIGITMNYKQRMYEHFCSKDNAYLHRSIRKYGKEKFKHEIVCRRCNWDDLCKKETELIKNLNTKIPNGYNMTYGGEGIPGYKWTDNQRKKLSEAHKNPSIETRKKLSEAGKGRKQTKESIRKTSEANKKLSHEQIIEIKQLLADGTIQSVIANKFNVVQTTISKIKLDKTYSDVKYNGLYNANKYPDRSKEVRLKMSKSQRKFSNKQILEIRKLLFNGISQAKIAKQFEVNQVTIFYIKSGKRYSDIQLPQGGSIT